jgi:multiple sugar transport system substrate-binding protein
LNIRIRLLAIIGSVLLCLGLIGCGAEPDTQAGSPSAEAPSGGASVWNTDIKADLSLYMDLGLSDEFIQTYIIDPVQRRFPNISIKIVRKGSGTNPGDLVAAGDFPDLLYSSTPRLTQYKELGLLYDMRELAAKYEVPLGSLNGPALDALRQWGQNGELYGLPLWVNFSVLYYNKDIFDKFGVDYPKDGMTWDEAIQLSERLTRSEGGVAYRGLDIHDLNGFYSQLSLPYVDSKTDEALLETDGFRKIYDTMMKLYRIPGNQNRTAAKDAFLQERTLAMWPMYADVPSWLQDLAAKGTPMNWDMAQMPSLPDKPNTAWQVDSHNLHVTSTSKNKEAAFMAVAHLLTEEPQTALALNGMLPALDKEEIKQQFGNQMAQFEGKNVQAIFKSQPAPKYPMHRFDSIVMGAFTSAFKDVESGAKDVNTALRDANEAANLKIREKKASE